MESPASTVPAHIRHRQFLIDELSLVTEVRSQSVWGWLSAGWADFRATAAVSGTYAASFVILGFVISFGFYFAGLPYLVLPALSGFLLVGPALGVGFYEISRRRAEGLPIRMSDPYLGFRRNTLGIMGLGVFLVFLFQVWIRTSFTIAGLSFDGVAPEWAAIIERAFTTFDGLYFFAGIIALGAVFASFVFFIAAFSMPLMMDRKTVLVPSLMVSAYAVWRNPSAMILWAALVVAVTAGGLITAMIGLIFTFPLLGHATWHAYKEVMSGEMPNENS